jgi:hypothetical protein
MAVNAASNELTPRAPALAAALGDSEAAVLGTSVGAVVGAVVGASVGVAAEDEHAATRTATASEAATTNLFLNILELLLIFRTRGP